MTESDSPWSHTNWRVKQVGENSWGVVPVCSGETETEEEPAVTCYSYGAALRTSLKYQALIRRFMEANGLWGADKRVLTHRDPNREEDSRRVACDHLAAWLNATEALSRDLTGAAMDEMTSLKDYLIQWLPNHGASVKNDNGVWRVFPLPRGDAQ